MNIIMNGKIQNNRSKKSFSRGTDPNFIKTQRGAAGSIRITSGEFRGRALISPRQAVTHPMGSRERLALFNAIGPHIKNKVVLDVFAGTGALGLEALSRGASHVTFIEKNHKVAEILRKNIKNLGLEDNTEIIEKDVLNFDSDDAFDYVFIDPPYDAIESFDIEKIMQKFSGANKIILSHPKGTEFELEGFDARTKTYAGAAVTIFTNKRD